MTFFRCLLKCVFLIHAQAWKETSVGLASLPRSCVPESLNLHEANVLHSFVKSPLQSDTLRAVHAKRVRRFGGLGHFRAPVYDFAQSPRLVRNGHEFRLLLLNRIIGVDKHTLFSVAAPGAMDSWFPGYTWEVLLCAGEHVDASHIGWRFISPKTGDEFYKAKCGNVFNEYLEVKRTADGAISHLPLTLELWDDTVFMIGEFMIAMYRATGDKKYLNELANQFRLHRET